MGILDSIFDRLKGAAADRAADAVVDKGIKGASKAMKGKSKKKKKK